MTSSGFSRSDTHAYELSYAQEQYWPGHNQASASQNTAIAFVITGQPSRTALERAFNHIVERHEILRTVLNETGGRVVQRVDPARVLPLESHTLGNAHGTDAALQYLAQEASKPFDLEHGPLVRAGLISVDDRHVFFLLAHHLVMDRWSCGVFLNELAAGYAAFRHDANPLLPRLPLQYHEYAKQQRQWLASADYRRQLGYWADRLAGGPQPVHLFPGMPAAGRCRDVTAREAFACSGPVVDGVHAAAANYRATPFMMCLAALKMVMFRYAGQEDTCVLCPIAARRRVEWEPLIGFLMNSVVIRTRLKGTDSCETVVQTVRDAALEAYAHQDVPLKEVSSVVSVEADEAARRIVFQMAPLPTLRLSGVESEYVPLIMKTSPRHPEALRHLALTVLASTRRDARRWIGSLEYDVSQCDTRRIGILWQHFVSVVSQICTDPRQSVESAVSAISL